MSDKAGNATRTQAAISQAEVFQLCNGLLEAMTQLERLLAEETKQVRSHAYGTLEGLNADKARLSKHYMDLMVAVREHLPLVQEVAPELIQRIRSQHDAMQIVIRDNLTAIGAARAVSENLLQTIADDVQKKRQPMTAYTASGGTYQSARPNPAIAVNEQF